MYSNNTPKYLMKSADGDKLFLVADDAIKEINSKNFVREIELDFNLALETEDLDINIPGYTQDELRKEIELLRSSSGCDTLEEYKRKINNNEIINFSRSQIKMWEELERLLRSLEETK